MNAPAKKPQEVALPEMLRAAEELLSFHGDGPAEQNTQDVKLERRLIAELKTAVSKAKGASQ